MTLEDETVIGDETAIEKYFHDRLAEIARKATEAEAWAPGSTDVEHLRLTSAYMMRRSTERQEDILQQNGELLTRMEEQSKRMSNQSRVMTILTYVILGATIIHIAIALAK